MPSTPPPVPPNLAGRAASAIVRQVEKQNNTPTRAQQDRNLRTNVNDSTIRKGREPKSSEQRKK